MPAVSFLTKPLRHCQQQSKSVPLTPAAAALHLHHGRQQRRMGQPRRPHRARRLRGTGLQGFSYLTPPDFVCVFGDRTPAWAALSLIIAYVIPGPSNIAVWRSRRWRSIERRTASRRSARCRQTWPAWRYFWCWRPRCCGPTCGRTCGCLPRRSPSPRPPTSSKSGGALHNVARMWRLISAALQLAVGGQMRILSPANLKASRHRVQQTHGFGPSS